MVYKRYIKKGGKVYGPYTYESKRVDGKVKSSYVGREISSVKTKKAASLSLFFLLSLFFVYFVAFGSFDFNLTGESVFEIDNFSFDDNNILGILRFNILGNEILPSNSTLVVSTKSNSYEFLLKDISHSFSR